MCKFAAVWAAFLLGAGAAFSGDITGGFSRDDTKNVVTDSVYKLMWQDGEEIFKGDYDEAVKYCENLTFAGFEDWRLPTINELISITDKSKFDPAINPAFKSVNSDMYYSFTKSAESMSNVWVVFFRNGVSIRQDASFRYFARCVRIYK